MPDHVLAGDVGSGDHLINARIAFGLADVQLAKPGMRHRRKKELCIKGSLQRGFIGNKA